VAVINTQKVNRVLGTQLWPWELYEIPQVWLDAILALERIPKIAKGLKELEKETKSK
jgi:hypothetical protein